MNADPALSANKTRRRKRSAVACAKCHQRKVRCSVSETGPPCTNCVHDGVACKAPLAKGKPASLPRLLPRRLAASSADASPPAVPVNAPRAVANFTGNRSTESIQSSSLSTSRSNEIDSPPSTLQAETPSRAPEVRLVRYRAADNLIADEEDSERISAGESMVIFAGNEKGLEFLFDCCYPDRPVKGNHYIIPRPPPMTEYAHDSGLQDPLLTSFPAEDVCKDLLCCYFQYVHPFLPIVDANDFLSNNNSPRSRSPLLRWSVFFAAANYVETQTLEKSGYRSRKAMKRAMYRQAKRLYDAEVEEDRVVMAQSAVLMSFWYADLEDRCGSWHWTGVAIGVCQTIGMHRNPTGTPGARHLYPHYQSWLWRRLWWSCYYRDVWLSLGFGRPMRINLDDCDTALPTLNDLLDDVAGSLEAAGGKLLYDDCLSLAKYWLNLVKLTILLGGILSNHYRPTSKPTVCDIEKAEAEILINSQEAQNHGRDCNKILTLHWCHLKAYYNTVIIALHRPHLLKSPPDLPEWKQEAFFTTSLQKVKTAASSNTSILSELISFDLINFCSAMIVTAMMASMQIHLHETKSLDPLTRQYALNQLDLHMTVLTELQKTYWSANMQHELFSRARTATKTLPPAPDAGLSQPIPAVTVPTEEPLPFHYNNIMGTPWNPYLNMPVELDLGSHHPGFVVDSSLDFFSPVPSVQVAEAPARAGQRNDHMGDGYD